MRNRSIHSSIRRDELCPRVHRRLPFEKYRMRNDIAPSTLSCLEQLSMRVNARSKREMNVIGLRLARQRFADATTDVAPDLKSIQPKRRSEDAISDPNAMAFTNLPGPNDFPSCLQMCSSESHPLYRIIPYIRLSNGPVLGFSR